MISALLAPARDLAPLVHLGHGFFIRNGGREFVGVIGAAAPAAAAVEPGRFGLDRVLVVRRDAAAAR